MSLQDAPTDTFLYVDTPDALRALCDRLAAQPWIGVDTEFLREKTYYAQLCLIQVSTGDVGACVDPLAVDIAPLLEVLYRADIVKVMHAARQDLEILSQTRSAPPPNIFDTQLAATVLGYGDQIGYAGLVEAVLNVRLDKAHTRTDWSQRPLAEEQLQYAADDVRYLGPLYERLERELVRRGRRNWLDEEFAALSDPALYAWSEETAWQKVSGAQALRGRQLALLNALTVWRERKAMTLDRPRRWVAADPVLIDIARRAPHDAAALARIRGVEGALLNDAPAVLAVLAEAARLPRDDWPAASARVRLAVHEEALVDALMATVRTVAAREGISAAALTSRRELERLVQGDDDVAVLHGWRQAVCGTALQGVLKGELTLRVQAGRLQLLDA
ncbi:ribonuclease D [Ectothiorhodospiraceae bacterium 2226]|nr:ribonuclease D [Ectothiorhodospiraceae bacterium 2226]